jgi:eukaryotic-like serine/threonine-protein kinase
MKFTFGSGQKPLDGFTIKRGVGKGGFGEVYFAVSDGGKEVALKYLHGDCGVELRGIAQCINLKHPNLVGVYDLKTDRQGCQWVVMEYVAGEPLHMVLDRHPKGLPRELAREWFLALARAVSYLHDRGIVHRDLKPANVFLEDGIIKVGDYGLCKSISASERDPNTQKIGTVHYMAPEISTGNYNKQIDLYACGVLLFEMLTGQVPFEGETPAEILMKHLTSTPDLNALPAEFRPLVAKALAKDPGQRYHSMAEFAQAVESMGQPSAKPVSPPPMPVLANPVGGPPAVRPAPPAGMIPEVTAAIPTTRGFVGELSGSLALVSVLGLLTTVFWSAIQQPEDWRWIGTTYFLTIAASWSILIPTKFWISQRREETWGRRMSLMGVGAMMGIFALWLDGWSFNFNSMRFSRSLDVSIGGTGQELLGMAAKYITYFALVFGLVRWWKMTDRRRKWWFSVWPVLVVGFWSLLLMAMFDQQYGLNERCAAALTTAAALVQLVSPYDPPPVVQPRRLRYRVN